MGLADVEKTPEPMRPIRKLEDGKYVAVYAGKAQVDYKGVMAGGRAVAFEAKFCTGEKIAKNRVKDWQMKQLTNYEKLGAKCFILVGWDSFAAAVPVHEWRTLRKVETEQWKVKINGENALEFLGGVSDFAE